MFGEARVPEMDRALRDHIVATGTADSVRIMGYRAPGPQWIAACDQLVVPAVGEPFGRTLIEAMLVGTPVIAARSGGNIEALEGGFGVLAEPDDADALAEGCARLARNPAQAAEMVKAAERDARDRFSTATHCALVSETYASLA
jgi:glycosyltransferase involved in cell wall biosynthesis